MLMVRLRDYFLYALALALITFLTGCGGGSSQPLPPLAADPTIVSISPTDAPSEWPTDRYRQWLELRV